MSEPRTRIAHIITGLEGGGAERSLFTLLQSGLQEHVDNHVISLAGPGLYGPRLEEMGIRVSALGLREGAGMPTALRRLVQIVRVFRPAVIQGWMYHGNLAASLAAAVSHSAAVSWNVRQSLDAPEIEKRGTKLVMQMLKWRSRSPRAIVYNSYRSREQHEDFGFSGRRSVVIPNGFDTRKWKPDVSARARWRARLGLEPTDIALGFVGRFHAVKDVPTFLRACDRALERVSDLKVVMVGEGLSEQNGEIVGAIAPKNRGRFRLLGPHGNIEDILPALDLFCLSSTNEGFPNVIGEAMATGLPCIATDVGDCVRLIDGTGSIVAVADAAGMANAIADWARMDLAHRVEIGEAARNRIITGYSVAATVDAYANLFDSITKRED